MSNSCSPMDHSLPGSPVHGILQASILEWVAISFSMGSSQPRNQTWVSCIEDRFLTDWTTREAPKGNIEVSKQTVTGVFRKRVCIHLYMYTHTHTHICTYTESIHTQTHTCPYTDSIHTHTHTHNNQYFLIQHTQIQFFK